MDNEQRLFNLLYEIFEIIHDNPDGLTNVKGIEEWYNTTHSYLMELMASKMIGKTAIFRYPLQFTTLPNYTAHAGQRVLIVRQLTEGECDQETRPMYLIRATDGWEGHADHYELEEVQNV